MTKIIIKLSPLNDDSEENRPGNAKKTSGIYQFEFT